MKLWDKGYKINQIIEEFTIGKDAELDLMLAKHDVIGTLAHIRMLQSINLLTKEELTVLVAELHKILQVIDDKKFVIESGIEDVHSQIELMLTRTLGDTGKKVHSGRSRNDQIILDLKLFFRDQIKQISDSVQSLFKTLIAQSEAYKDVLLPGYTHLQIAMPSSFGLWFGAYAESLTDDMLQLQAAYRVTNQNPLGPAAGYGSSFPLNRTMTTELLAFETLNFNSVYAQMTRGKTEKIIAFAISSIAATLAKMAMDVCLYMNQNFGFISFPDEYTTGSSIMPHKKNPDVFELIRAKCNKLQALPTEIMMITNNLPSGYHRDLQITKEVIFPAFHELNSCLTITEFMLQQIKVKRDILENDMYKYLFSVEEVNNLVLNGVAFRDAYKSVSNQINTGTFNPSRTVNHTHEGSIMNLCNDKISEKMDKIVKEFNFLNERELVARLVS